MRLIDADALPFRNITVDNGLELDDITVVFKRDVDSTPTVEPNFGVFKSICCEDCDKNARQRGEWLGHQGLFFECTICKYRVAFCRNFCPNCGADMREETEE